ncbi:MAG TPA: tetratricopeptide repeat protein [Candidatus Acidoferrum sp.]|nr:tetratricopeptide repeat protein [Candidatus Acidoferrum sp.]
MKDLLPLLQKQKDLEKAFVTEAAAKAQPSAGWTPSMTMFHIASWRERLSNGLSEADAERAVTGPPGNIDEFNDKEMEGAAGVSLAAAATRADAAFTSIIAMWETMGDQPFNWFNAETIGEAILRNSYLHPRIHLADQFLERGEAARSQRLTEETVSELRAISAPARVLGAAIYNLAAVHARQRQTEKALDLLEESLALREDLRAGAAEDKDFASVWGEPRFRALTSTT